MKNDHFERRLLTVVEANTSDLTARQQDRIIGAVRQELSLLDSEAAGTNYLHHAQFPMNGTELECDGEELRPDGMCAKCERVNERIEAKIAAVRQEERRAVWADAIATAKNELWADTSAEYGPHRAQQNTVINCVMDALEAAANETREDGDDG